jgi:hypothetical protein
MDEITKKPPTNRLWTGSIVLITGFLSPLLIPLVLSSGLSSGIKSILSGLLAFGIPEIFMLVAIGILGKEGYAYLKGKVFAIFKKISPEDTVGAVRYKIGLVLFTVPFLLGFIWPYAGYYVPENMQNSLYVHIGGDAMICISLFVLGGDFWDKLRSLFIHKSRAILINNQTTQND